MLHLKSRFPVYREMSIERFLPMADLYQYPQDITEHHKILLDILTFITGTLYMDIGPDYPSYMNVPLLKGTPLTRLHR